MFVSLTVLLCACTFFEQISSSAIPVWELLSKEEKMSYLYSMFANQVEDFCEFSENKNCSPELLKYGLKKLKALPEEVLDNMDPYQRGANHIIWDSMMEGHALMKTTPKMRTTTTPKPNSYDDNLSFSAEDLGNQAAASAKIDNGYRVQPPKDFVYITPSPNGYQYNLYSGTPEYKQPQGVKPQNQLPFENILSSTSVPKKFVAPYGQDVPLTGPMVVRVHPDGTPVQEGPESIPQDEDLRQYMLSQIRLPAV